MDRQSEVDGQRRQEKELEEPAAAARFKIETVNKTHGKEKGTEGVEKK